MSRIPLPALALVCLCLAIARPAGAQTVTQPAAPTSVAPLPIALPDGAKLQTELDGTDSDILGMVKNLLEGIADPATVAGGPQKAGAIAAKGDPTNDSAPDWMKVLTDGELTTLLKDVHHLHFVAFTIPPQATGATTNAHSDSDDIVAFYEKPLQAAGGHRLLWQAGDPQILIESEAATEERNGFTTILHSGFTAVYRGGIHVVVVRADGYPNLKIIGSLVRTFFTPGEPSFTVSTGTERDSPIAKQPVKPTPKKARVVTP